MKNRFKTGATGLVIFTTIAYAAFISVLLLILTPSKATAGEAYPYIGVGFYHRDCTLTDSMICTNDKMGSDTPTTIDVGFRVEGCNWYCLNADHIDIGWHHQSYIDRGRPFNHNPEAQYDMYGVKFQYNIDSLKATW